MLRICCRESELQVLAECLVEVLNVVCCLGVDVLARYVDVLAGDLRILSDEGSDVEAAAARMVESRRTLSTACMGAWPRTLFGCICDKIIVAKT